MAISLEPLPGVLLVMHADDVVTIYTVKDPTQAEIIRGALHAEGIACEIEGEGQAGLAGIIDIKINVRVEDADRATRLIQSHMAGEIS